MKFSEFLFQIPFLCGAKYPENCAETLKAVFAAELDGKAKFIGSAMGRVGFIFALMANCEKPEVLEHCKNLAVITALAHRELEHKEVLQAEESATYKELVAEAGYFESDKLATDVGYTVADALTGIWG